MELSNTGMISIINRRYQQAILTLESGEEIHIDGYDNIGKCFHGDFGNLDPSGKLLVTQSNISDKIIVGTLKYFDRTKFSSNKRGVERYKFVPLSPHYPNFLVTSKNKSKYQTNVIATIKFSDWKGTLPQGHLQQIIGPVDNYQNLYEGILWKHQLIQKYFKLNGRQKSQIKYFEVMCKGYSDTSNEYTISIDPEGCLDIDDAFSWEILDNPNHLILKIHISDVIGTMNELGLNKMLNNLTTSVYAPHKTSNMFQNILSQGALSLLPNKKRLTISLYLEINEGEIINSQLVKSIIINHKAFSYEDFEKKHFNNKKSEIYPIINIIKNLNYPILGNRYSKYFDSHKLIEKLMVIYNCEVVRLLHQSDLKPIYRVHQSNDSLEMKENIPRELEKFLSIIKNKAAIYTFDSSDTGHAALGINNYTHFTSPIRRYVDCYNHRLVHNMLNNENKIIPISLELINNFNSRVKKMERDSAKISMSQYIDASDEHNFSGYIYNINQDRMIDFYIPKRKLNVHFKIHHENLDDILDLNVEKNMIVISHRDTNKIAKIPLFQTIDLEIFVCPQKDNPYRDLTFRIGILDEIIK
jgi:exoribonuclease R